jgi:hypothetical protein
VGGAGKIKLVLVGAVVITGGTLLLGLSSSRDALGARDRVGDTHPEQVLCQDVQEFGGRWYAVTADGEPVL